MRMPLADGSLEVASGRGRYVCVLKKHWSGGITFWTSEFNRTMERITGEQFEVLAVAIPEGLE